jgi:hypothetical protein
MYSEVPSVLPSCAKHSAVDPDSGLFISRRISFLAALFVSFLRQLGGDFDAYRQSHLAGFALAPPASRPRLCPLLNVCSAFLLGWVVAETVSLFFSTWPITSMLEPCGKMSIRIRSMVKCRVRRSPSSHTKVSGRPDSAFLEISPGQEFWKAL